jgi:hypothetical protein
MGAAIAAAARVANTDTELEIRRLNGVFCMNLSLSFHPQTAYAAPSSARLSALYEAAAVI